MSALDELKKKNPMDLTMLEYVVTESDYRELGGNAEEAAAELAALEAVERVTMERLPMIKEFVNNWVGIESSAMAVIGDIEEIEKVLDALRKERQ